MFWDDSTLITDYHLRGLVAILYSGWTGFGAPTRWRCRARSGIDPSKMAAFRHVGFPAQQDLRGNKNIFTKRLTVRIIFHRIHGAAIYGNIM